MNQILVSEKLYVTPELKRKKKLYKFNFVFSIISIIVLFGYYVYGEYDRASSDKSEEILSALTVVEENKQEVISNEDGTVRFEDNVLVVVLDDTNESEEEVDLEQLIQANKTARIDTQIYQTEAGDNYSTVAVLNIPKIDITYPVIYSENTSEQTTEDLLKISIMKYWGPEANMPGNFCIIGHNYRNKRFFSNLSKLVNGDKIYLTDKTNKTLEYRVYASYVIEPTDVRCTSQLTNGNTDITLITCAQSGQKRTVVKARAVNQ